MAVPLRVLLLAHSRAWEGLLQVYVWMCLVCPAAHAWWVTNKWKRNR
jgi:hypothetical protein